MNKSSRTEVEEFLRRFRRGLAALAPDVREDLASEVQSHFEERQAQEKLDLDAFGSPEEYASRFVNTEALRAAVTRDNPLQLIAVLLGRVRATAFVICVVLPLAVLEIIGLALVVIGFCKPFSSGHIGLFLGADGRFGALGWVNDPGSMREVLGYAAMPVFIFGGLLLFWACYRLLLRVARRELASMRVDRVS
ncbi:MAG: hypothetical protein ABSF62_17260 [Bryobacteraceae bacterium]|jgi:uncharacterized membrane protein